jgi:hypothetical protein
VAFRLEPYPGDDFDPTVPPKGIIEDSAVDSYGNVILFVVGPNAGYEPKLKQPKDCRQKRDG